MLECPINKYSFAIDFNDYPECNNVCSLKTDCEKIKLKYKIKDIYETITFRKANEFVKDVFNGGWSHYYSMRDFAILKGFAKKEIKGTKKEKWVISYKDIFIMLYELIPAYQLTPLYKRNNTGFLYSKRPKKEI